MTAFGYDISDFMACECCGKKAVDLHHIDPRGMGSTDKDYIENLMSLCRDCHMIYGDKKNYKKMLYLKHSTFMDVHGVKFDRKLMAELIEKS